MTATKAEISATMMLAWASMAKSNNPSTSEFKWPAWNYTSSLGMLIEEDGVSDGVVN